MLEFGKLIPETNGDDYHLVVMWKDKAGKQCSATFRTDTYWERTISCMYFILHSDSECELARVDYAGDTMDFDRIKRLNPGYSSPSWSEGSDLVVSTSGGVSVKTNNIEHYEWISHDIKMRRQHSYFD